MGRDGDNFGWTVPLKVPGPRRGIELRSAWKNQPCEDPRKEHSRQRTWLVPEHREGGELSGAHLGGERQSLWLENGGLGGRGQVGLEGRLCESFGHRKKMNYTLG